MNDLRVVSALKVLLDRTVAPEELIAEALEAAIRAAMQGHDGLEFAPDGARNDPDCAVLWIEDQAHAAFLTVLERAP